MTTFSSFRRDRKVTKALSHDPVMRSVERQLSSFLKTQITMADRSGGVLNRAGSDASAEPRGYIIGAAEGIIRHCQIDASFNDRGTITVARAFRIAYGADGWNLALDTLTEVEQQNAFALDGRARALLDLDQVYFDQSCPAAAGLFVILRKTER